MNFLLFLLSIFPLILLINASTYYVSEESLAAPQTGSFSNPFTSIAQAYSSLGAITCNLVLLGSRASISTTIAFTTRSNYTIRPDTSFTSSTHFPIYLQSGAAITVTSAVLILQKLQFVELDPSRTTKNSFLTTSLGSTLTLQSILMRDTRTTANYYFFCMASDGFVNILNSEFRNLTDFTTSLIRSPVVVRGSTFTDISSISTGFMSQAYYKGPIDGFAFKNNTFQNINIGLKTSSMSFIYSAAAHINVTFEDFYINSVTFTQSSPFLSSYASSSSYVDTENDQTTMMIRNGIIQNMIEKPSPDSANLGFFINNNQQTILKVHDLSVTNSIFSNSSLLKSSSITAPFVNTWKVLPYVELTDITLKYTRNANFVISFTDTVNISNVYLEGLSTKDVNTTFAAFDFSTGHIMNVKNVTAKNVTGAIFGTVDVLAHNFSTLSFNDMYSSQELPINLQNIIYFHKIYSADAKGLDSRRPRDSFFDNINLNGYTRIGGVDYTQIANNSNVIFGSVIYGKVYLANSVWYNNLMSGFKSNALSYLEVDNLTIAHDPEIPREQIPQHRGFYLKNAKEVVLKNSVFQDNQNFVILHLKNLAAQSITYEITETYLTFENITVLNNQAIFYDTDSQYFSLFIISCPTKPANVLFYNSYFYNNTNLNGLINSMENYQTNMNFTNNTFDNNYAAKSGAVFSSTNMRQKTSSLNLTNNTFINNRCDQNGGVFYFIQTDYNMHPVNNTYINNTAGLAGGVGYAFRASFIFLEEQGAYKNNSAGSSGGDWYFNLNAYQANLQSLEFSKTSFVNSLARQKGGSIYLDNGRMTISKCTFNNSKAFAAGGNFYVAIGKSINIIDTNFATSSAPQGSFLYAEELDGTLTISNVQMRDISSGSGFILGVTSGAFNIANSVFENINSPLFLLSGVTTSITKTIFNQISCPKTSNSFCVLKTTSSSSKTIKITNTFFSNIYSNVDLMSLSDCSQVVLSHVNSQNMLKLTQKNLDQIFVLNTLNVKALNIDQSDFSHIGFSGIKVKKTNIGIQHSIFSNRPENSRLLSQSFNDDLYSAKFDQPIQFMVLDSSNSTLTSISFIENSLNPLIDGGAAQILGSGGVHTLKDCIFENNQALNGGALSVKGQANSISILNSQFNNNQAHGNGGALFFSDQSVKHFLLITQTTFSQNIASLGGAIYLGNQALTMDSSSLIENNAERGGAIATVSDTQNLLVNVRQSSFIKNNASEGAALIALQEMNLAYSTSSFKRNTATYGGDVASMPTSLSLKIYQFESYFLFVNDITAKDLLSDPKTVIIYDSTTASPSEPIAFISGAHPNLLFEITILDALGQKMGQTNNALGAFQTSNSSSSSSLVGMLGTPTFTYINSTAYIFKAFSVKGPFETTFTLSIEGSYLSKSSNSIQSLPSFEFPIILDKCSVGQIYEQSTAICSYCSGNTYSIADPFADETCQKCFDHLVCLGGSLTYPAPGYWRIDESSENLIKCPQTDSCLGGSKDGGKSMSLTGFCKEGYEGVACSSCSSGYAKFGSSESCVNCKESKLYYVMFGGYLLIQTIAIILSIKMNLKESSKKNSVVQTTLIKIVIDFVQILSLVSEFNFNFPPIINSLYGGVSKILPTNIDALSVDCFIALKKGTNKHIFFNKVLVILAEPFAFLILAFIIWVIIFRVKRRAVLRNPDFKYNIRLTIIVIIYVLQPGIVKLTLELFNYIIYQILISCKNYGSIEDPKYYLVSDVNVECWKHEHLVWALSIAIPTLIIGLLVPFTILAFWTREKGLRVPIRAQKAHAFIFKPYKNNAFFWELAIFTRKILLIFISIFITSQYLQAYIGFVLLGLYCYLLFPISPYTNPQLNLAESISLASSAFILYSGLYFTRVNNMNTVSYILFACDIISGIIFVAYIIYAFLKKHAPTIQRKITRLGTKILTNLKIKPHVKHIRIPSLQSPISLQSNGLNDSPRSTTERIMSTERFITTERVMPTEGFMSTERAFLTDRFIMSTESPLSPVIKIRKSEKEEDISKSKRNNSIEIISDELIVFSPANQTQAGLFVFDNQPRESSLPMNLHELGLPAEDPDFQQFAETLKHESRNSPRRSERNKIDKVFKFTKEDWINQLSKKNSENHSN